jgi:GH25 family lysozyme M1 (1,4-beta-N-acetylmuramidase)
MAIEDLAFGIDISRYNYHPDGSVKPDFNIMKQKCKFVAVRSGISWGYADPWFSYSWANLADTNRMAYHVPYFGESAQAQMDNFFKIVNDADWEHDRLVLDHELAHTNSKYTITQKTIQMIEIIKSRVGRYPIIYSRANWIDAYLNVADLPRLDWWLAQYRYSWPYPLYTPELTPPPTLPKGEDTWLIQQTGARYSGKEVGVYSYFVDSNRWNGGDDAVDEYFNGDSITIPLPPINSVEERLTALETKMDQVWEKVME